MPKTINDSLVDDQILNCFETHAQSPGLKVHLTPKNFFAKIVKLILWSKLAQKFFDLVKSSSFYAPSKPSFEWFTTAHGESGERHSCDVKSRTNASPVPVRSSILHECRSDFAAQVFCWDSTVNRFLFLVTMSSTSSDSKIVF